MNKLSEARVIRWIHPDGDEYIGVRNEKNHCFELCNIYTLEGIAVTEEAIRNLGTRWETIVRMPPKPTVEEIVGDADFFQATTIHGAVLVYHKLDNGSWATGGTPAWSPHGRYPLDRLVQVEKLDVDTIVPLTKQTSRGRL